MSERNKRGPMSGYTIRGSWRKLLGCEYVDEWTKRTNNLYKCQGENIFPARKQVFRAFAECPLDQLKVVIVGEQPYENNRANGLAFSVSQAKFLPPSLWIIFSEICHDICLSVDHKNGDLSRWAQQGVLLLNSRLTIGQNKGSIKWGNFTNTVIREISDRQIPTVFMLWGVKAIKKYKQINNTDGRHKVLKSSHPSPQSAFERNEKGVRFAGCRHFSKANKWLKKERGCVVDWK